MNVRHIFGSMNDDLAATIKTEPVRLCEPELLARPRLRVALQLPRGQRRRCRRCRRRRRRLRSGGGSVLEAVNKKAGAVFILTL